MEPPAKRQKIANKASHVPTRTLDLRSLQRAQDLRRSLGRVILPRAPDVTVVSEILEVAVNEGSTSTQIPVPTADVAITLDSLGPLTLPGLATSSDVTSLTTSGTSASASISGGNSTSITSTTETTVTVTSTSTFHVSYNNGTFIAPKATYTPSTYSSLDESTTSDSSAESTFRWGQYASETSSVEGTVTDSAYNNAAVAATATNSESSPSSSSKSDGNSGSSGPVLTPQQTQMVGGIVGGVAGIALVLVVLLYVLRWYRERLKQQGRLPEQLKSNHSRDFGGSGLITSAAPMAQSSRSLFMPTGAIAAGTKKWRPSSNMTTLTNTTSSTRTESEKGFQRVSGRKIPPVLSTGGDQYGGSYGAFEKEMNGCISGQAWPSVPRHQHDLSESSFYRDAEGTYMGNGRPASRSAPTTPVFPTVFNSDAKSTSKRRPSLALAKANSDFGGGDLHSAFYRNLAKPDGVAVYRNSPARTPVTQSPTTSSIALPIQAPVTMDADIPEMPLPSPGIGVALSANYGYVQHHPPNRISPRGSGRFRENIA